VRVTFKTLHDQGTAGIEGASTRLLNAQRQVSSGRRIDRPSDDPSASATSVVERSSVAATEQYQKAANSVLSRLTVADTVLTDLIDKLTAAQSQVLAAQGNPKTDQERETAAQALLGLREAIFEDLNTSFRGTYIFGGAAGTVRPYAKNGSGGIDPYAGSTREVQIDIDSDQSIAVAFDGDALARGSEADNVFTVLDQAVTAARNGDSATLTQTMGALERAFARATELQSRVGAGMRAVEDQTTRLTQIRITGQARVAELENVDMADAITRMTEADAAYRAALGAASKAASVSLIDYLR
jgi:flagellar hook-associated protein 3 FlgL